MTLPKETIEKIKADAETYMHNETKGNAHEAGATEWAGRAQGLIEALKQIEQMSDPGDYWKAIFEMKSIASDAIAKYKEVSNG